jgi:biopolymer transport protein ExbD
MPKKKGRSVPEINASSMADIAFLLLIFFLVTTTIGADKGINMLLPPKREDTPPIDLHDRNLFKVILNSRDQLLVEDEPMDVGQLREEAKRFLANNGADPTMSDNPQKAVISLKTDRGTTYSTYLTVLDELQAAYNELRAQSLNISVERYLQLDEGDTNDKQALDYAQKAFPRQLSLAEPTAVGGR